MHRAAAAMERKILILIPCLHLDIHIPLPPDVDTHPIASTQTDPPTWSHAHTCSGNPNTHSRQMGTELRLGGVAGGVGWLRAGAEAGGPGRRLSRGRQWTST